MPIKRLLAVLAAALSVALPAAAAEHGHDHGHAGAKPALTLDQGRKWQTDAPLRQGMEAIRHRMAAALPAIHGGKLPAARYDELGRQVQAEIAAMVANCKLAPEADAQLHIVIATLAEGAEAMAGKAKQTPRRNGAVKVLGALDDYAAHFDHPGWQPIEH